MNCPKCDAVIANENINIQKDIAKCELCNHVFMISEMVAPKTKFDPNLPPQGTWYTNDFENTIVGSTTRSKAAFFLVPFMVVWSGFSLGGIYGTQIISGKFNPIFALFGIPFIIGTVVLGAYVIMTIAGKIEITFNSEGGKIFTGVGKIGFTKSFLWKDINTIEESLSNMRSGSSNYYQINLIGQKRISFGSGLSDERRYYIMSVLRNHLKNRR